MHSGRWCRPDVYESSEIKSGQVTSHTVADGVVRDVLRDEGAVGAVDGDTAVEGAVDDRITHIRSRRRAVRRSRHVAHQVEVDWVAAEHLKHTHSCHTQSQRRP
jgi:hypothetical protein